MTVLSQAIPLTQVFAGLLRRATAMFSTMRSPMLFAIVMPWRTVVAKVFCASGAEEAPEWHVELRSTARKARRTELRPSPRLETTLRRAI